MCPEQWEPILVLVDHRNGDLPALHGMTGVASRAKLPLMNVGVTISAFFPHVREYELGMTLRARHPSVHASERVTCLIVIELWDLSDRLPRCERVAVLACH